MRRKFITSKPANNLIHVNIMHKHINGSTDKRDRRVYIYQPAIISRVMEQQIDWVASTRRKNVFRMGPIFVN